MEKSRDELDWENRELKIENEKLKSLLAEFLREVGEFNEVRMRIYGKARPLFERKKSN